MFVKSVVFKLLIPNCKFLIFKAYCNRFANPGGPQNEEPGSSIGIVSHFGMGKYFSGTNPRGEQGLGEIWISLDVSSSLAFEISQRSKKRMMIFTQKKRCFEGRCFLIDIDLVKHAPALQNEFFV